jgi:hypothetical protein
MIVQTVSLLSLCHTPYLEVLSFRKTVPHFRNALYGLLENCQSFAIFVIFTPFSRLVNVSYQQLFLSPSAFPSSLLTLKNVLSAPAEGVRLLTWPFTLPEIAPSAGTTGALQSLSPTTAIGRSMGAAPPAATKSLGRSSCRNPFEMGKHKQLNPPEERLRFDLR